MKKIITIHFIGGSNIEVNKTEAVDTLLHHLEGTERQRQLISLPNRSGQEIYINLKLVTSIEVKSI